MLMYLCNLRRLSSSGSCSRFDSYIIFISALFFPLHVFHSSSFRTILMESFRWFLGALWVHVHQESNQLSTFLFRWSCLLAGLAARQRAPRDRGPPDPVRGVRPLQLLIMSALINFDTLLLLLVIMIAGLSDCCCYCYYLGCWCCYTLAAFWFWHLFLISVSRRLISPH